MKGNRGVTLTSLIVYIIGMLIMLATLATLRTFFSKNVDIRAINDDTIQYSKFASAFSTETNTKYNKVIECRTQIDEKGEKVSYIVFSSGNQYTYMEDNHSIYKNKYKICESIQNCEFSFDNNKNTITVEFKTNSIDLTGDNAVTYALKK